MNEKQRYRDFKNEKGEKNGNGQARRERKIN
jgi:hypothetical protein